MNNYKLTTAVTVTILFLTGFAGTAGAGIKCWTNNEGVKECGNVVPPEYSQKGHEELSDQGVTVKKTARAKTLEELDAEEEAERQQAERERLAKEQAARDRVLLDTFTTEEDLILTRDGKLNAIDTRIAHTRQVTVGLEGQREDLEVEAANQERAGKAVSDELIADIDSVERQIADQMAFIESREQEKIEVRTQFDADLVRYRQLKGN